MCAGALKVFEGDLLQNLSPVLCQEQQGIVWHSAAVQSEDESNAADRLISSSDYEDVLSDYGSTGAVLTKAAAVTVQCSVR